MNLLVRIFVASLFSQNFLSVSLCDFYIIMEVVYFLENDFAVLFLTRCIV